MNIRDLLNHATKCLMHIESAQLDAEVLLAYCLNKDRAYLFAWPEQEVKEEIQEQFLNLIKQRKTHYPIAYLTGEKEFWSLNLKVSEDTLIPRPETELLVEHSLEKINQYNYKNILELATGSGAISIALASEKPELSITATDISDKALSIAKQNAENHNCKNIEFVQGNWFEPAQARYDLIVVNPPYIAEQDSHLTTGDVQYEPRNALASGKQGLDDIQIIISQAANYLNQDSHLLLEHGYDQAESVRALFARANFTDIQCIKDYSGLDRVSFGKLRL